MKQLFILFLIISLFSCSNDVSKDNDNGDSKEPVTNNGPGQSLIQNKSIVLAKLISKDVTDEINFTLKANVINVEEQSNYESIAVAGDEYTLKPGFYYDDNNEISDNERNIGLKKLAELNVGDEFKAEISLEQSTGWIINKVLK